MALVSVAFALGRTAASPADDGAQTAKLTEVVHGRWNSFPGKVVPAYGGTEAIIYRSADGKRVAGAFTHSGQYSFTFPFDEFLFVTSGSVVVSVRGGSTFMLEAGDVAYFREGLTADFSAGEDYANVAMFVDDQPIEW